MPADDQPALDPSVVKRVADLFSDTTERALVIESLSRCGTERPSETRRVHLAILRLAGCDIGQVERYTEAALVDYRDVLWWGEYEGR